MQNFDFYNGNNERNLPPQFDRHDPEFFSQMSKIHSKEEKKNKKRASRMMFFIAALCIISFTTGLAIGIKFAGGQSRQILDKKTFNAVTGIGEKVTNLVNSGKTDKKPSGTLFPKNEYPFTIRVGNEFDYSESQLIAKYLSSKGHTVILLKNNHLYRIYTGPYKNHTDANASLNKFNGYKKYSLASNAKIIKRQ